MNYKAKQYHNMASILIFVATGAALAIAVFLSQGDSIGLGYFVPITFLIASTQFRILAKLEEMT